MRPTQPARKMIKGRPTEGLKRSHSRWLHNRQCADDIEIVRTTNHWEIWICQRGEPRRCAGSVGLTLASDALRQGQDLGRGSVERHAQTAGTKPQFYGLCIGRAQGRTSRP